ncbi:MAG: fibronectin type III domain-containing protein [Proteobacteria bacterium]|nr:fibronectin type III domain-containing protein [Pseudomonadota bacterium]
MPTISQLPAATSVDPADQVPLSQGGTTRSVTVGEMLASMQSAIMAPTGVLLGRVSLGPGGPEPIVLGTGLAMSSNAVQATGADHAGFPAKASLVPTDQVVLSSGGAPALLPLSTLRGLFTAGSNVTIDTSGVISAAAAGATGAIATLSQVTALAPTDLVGVSQGGSDHAITYANLLDGATIDQGSPAGAVADTDLFWVGQGSSTMLAQSMAAVWSWIAGHMPGYRAPVVEITGNTTLDGSTHNGRLLVVSKPATLSPSATQGSGFACKVINVSGGTVAFDTGIVSTSGSQTLANGQCADVVSAAYSGGTVNIAWLSGGAAGQAPSQVLGVAIGAVTYSSATVTWAVPVLGGVPSGYAVQYRVTGQSGWTTQSVTGTSAILSGLVSSTGYDVEVIASNAFGAGPASTIVTAATAAQPSSPPGTPTGLAASSVTSTSLMIAWTAPTTGGAVGTYTVQYRITGQSTWTTFSSSVAATSVSVTGLAPSTQYDLSVFAVNSVGSGGTSSILTATTLVAGPGTPGALSVASIGQTSATANWLAPASGGAVASYVVQYRLTGATAWTQVSGLVALTYALSGLTAGSQYEVQVAAVNAGGTSAFTASTQFTTLVATPGTPASLAATSATSTTQMLTWSAPSSGGAPATYNVRYSLASANAWTTVSGIAGTTVTISGLSSATAYDYEVQAANAGGSSAWTAAVTSTTAVQSNYLLTPFAPAAGYTAPHGTNGIVAQVNDNSASGDGGHTVPHAVNVAWSTSSTAMPTSGLQSTVQYSNAGHNLWVTYANGPATAGTSYLWGIAYDSGNNVVATCVSTGFVFT